jgi:hypothetical protein
MMTLVAWALALQDGAAYEDPSREIQWARSWEKAYDESRARNVPIWIFVTSDT